MCDLLCENLGINIFLNIFSGTSYNPVHKGIVWKKEKNKKQLHLKMKANPEIADIHISSF